MEIRFATKDDKQKLLELFQVFRVYCRKAGNPDTSDEIPKVTERHDDMYDLVLSDKNAEVVVAEEGKELVGLCTIYKKPELRRGTFFAEVEEFYVDPEFHGKGVAQKLMDKAVAWAQDNGAWRVKLKSETALARAHAFYKKYGFEQPGVYFKKQISEEL